MFSSSTRAVILLASALAIAGCSTHPLPEDVTRETTFDIVQKVRCEARDGIFKANIEKHPDLALTTIGFDFTFTITEKDNASQGELSFLSPVNGGTFTLGLKGGIDKQRLNERVFRVIDNLADLRDDQSCLPENLRANFVYPMAGTIGLSEVVETFAKLRGFTPALRKIKDTENIFSDRIEFTTFVTAGITPTLKVATGVGSLHLTNAAIAGNVERNDVHAVTIAIAKTAPTTKKFVSENVPAKSFGPAAMAPYSVSGSKALRAPAQHDSGDGTANVINELDRLRYIENLREFPFLRLTQ